MHHRKMTQSRLDKQHPLPPIHDPVIEQRIFRHKSVFGRPAGRVHHEEPGDDNESLAFLGDSVIGLIVTMVLRVELPLSRPGDLSIKRALLVNQDRLAGWADIYGLSKRIQAHHSTRLLIQQNTSTRAQVFQAYVGGLFEQAEYNLGPIEDWLGHVVETALKEILAMEKAEDDLSDAFSKTAVKDEDRPFPLSRNSSLSPYQSKPSSHPSSTNQTKTSTLPKTPVRVGALALFNQRCQQEKLVPSWCCTQEGEPHAPTFTVTIKLPPSNTPIGEGIGVTKAEAKARAAEQALREMHWA